jgi:hypothetical protein
LRNIKPRNVKISSPKRFIFVNTCFKQIAPIVVGRKLDDFTGRASVAKKKSAR